MRIRIDQLIPGELSQCSRKLSMDRVWFHILLAVEEQVLNLRAVPKRAVRGGL
jgi:hypothetical protein